MTVLCPPVKGEASAASGGFDLGFQNRQGPKQIVGVIGLGTMGSAMSANLVKAGFEVRGYDVVAGSAPR